MLLGLAKPQCLSIGNYSANGCVILRRCSTGSTLGGFEIVFLQKHATSEAGSLGIAQRAHNGKWFIKNIIFFYALRRSLLALMLSGLHYHVSQGEQPCSNPVSRPDPLTHDPGNTTLLEQREVAVVQSLVASGYASRSTLFQDCNAIALRIQTDPTPCLIAAVSVSNRI